MNKASRQARRPAGRAAATASIICGYRALTTACTAGNTHRYPCLPACMNLYSSEPIETMHSDTTVTSTTLIVDRLHQRRTCVAVSPHCMQCILTIYYYKVYHMQQCSVT
jgi:hypothetical protein